MTIASTSRRPNLPEPSDGRSRPWRAASLKSAAELDGLRPGHGLHSDVVRVSVLGVPDEIDPRCPIDRRVKRSSKTHSPWG